MLKIDYKQYPGRKISKIEFELDEKQKPIISIITPYFNSKIYRRNRKLYIKSDISILGMDYSRRWL